MKRLTTIALVLVLALSMFAGCRSRQEDETTGNNGANATQGDMLPDTGDMLPDRNDKVDPTNGANRDDTPPTIDTPMGTDEGTGSNGDSSSNGNSDGNSADSNARGRNSHRPMR